MAVGKIYLHRAFSASFCLLLAALLCALPATAETNLISPGSWNLFSKDKESAEYKVLSDTSFNVTIKHASKDNFNVQIGHRILHEMTEGQPLHVRFEARAAESNMIVATVEKTTEPYTRAMNEHIHLTPKWKAYDFTCFVPKYKEGDASLRFMVADHAGTIEFRAIDVELITDTAFGGGLNLLSDAQINSRIERFRKGTLTIKIVKDDNKPVANASVHIQQTHHQFLFGCNIFGLDLQDDTEEQRTYRQSFLKLFNYATLPFYWSAFEPKKGECDYKKLDEMAKWCQDHNLVAKGHPLVWHQTYPSWAPADADSAVPIMQQRVTDLVSHYKGLVDTWDIVNEATAASVFQHPNGETQWITRDGAAKVVETVLDWAREAAGTEHETFLYNDYQTNSQTLELLSALQQDKKLPDAIGIQAHMHQGRWPLLQLWSTCEEFAQFGRPLQFSETTVISGPVRFINWEHPPDDWLTTDDGEKQQAAYAVQYYKVLFSHPAVQAITWWDLSDKGAWANAPGGLLRKDLTPKPAYHALYELIHERWWSDVKNKTDQSGISKARVFFGDHNITVTSPTGTSNTVAVHLTSDQPDQTITIKVH